MGGLLTSRIIPVANHNVKDIIDNFIYKHYVLEEYKIIGSYNDGKETLSDIDIVSIDSIEDMEELCKKNSYTYRIIFGNMISIEYPYKDTFHQIDIVCIGNSYDDYKNENNLDFIYNMTTNRGHTKFSSKQKCKFLVKRINEGFRKVNLLEDRITHQKYFSFWVNPFDAFHIGHRTITQHGSSREKKSIIRISNWERFLEFLDVKSLDTMEDIWEQFQHNTELFGKGDNVKVCGKDGEYEVVHSEPYNQTANLIPSITNGKVEILSDIHFNNLTRIS